MGALNITQLVKERSFYSEFQPLWDTVSENIFAFEAFIRTAPRMNPVTIFENARKKGVLYEFDTASISNAIKEFPYVYLNKYYLFVNVFPSTIVHHDFPIFIEGLLNVYPDIKHRIVFEINEAAIEENYWDQEIFLSRLAFLKSSGFRVAFDDIPVCKTSLQKIMQLAPDFIKLDPSHSEQLTDSLEKQQNIKFLLNFVHAKTDLVLEGIETKDDLLTAKKLGVTIMQGYYISKPQRL
ncbi:EAL domain-containing protein [Bacillus sp. T33-2]|uniref:EAL domain-containing protein n=1 Tax=Bacillus sp. T33-2 TaxID=2054168 RepID=UPI000C77CA9F|nr:EAL domain-containing protein [Bacillus sp. T33-2]PLR91930.1 diguanylate phosphodiesterase [Bacillus sp. T33-2]